MTGSVQVSLTAGIVDPAISWVGQTLSLHEPNTKPTYTSADMYFRANGTYARQFNAGVPTELGQFITPASAVAANNILIKADFVAGVTTYVTGPGLNIWRPLSDSSTIWGCYLVPPLPTPTYGNVILRFTLLNGYTGLQIGNTIDVNYDVQRV